MPFEAHANASASGSLGVGFGASASATASLGERAGNTKGAQPGGKDLAENLLPPLIPFRFQLVFRQAGNEVAVCEGAFAECSGLEATMEPKLIKVGGVNYGAAQRAGPVSFSTVILKRGMTRTRDLWTWFSTVAIGGYAHRLDAQVDVQNAAGDTVLSWGLKACMPVKFKAADLNGKGSEIAIEELHLVHEGLSLVAPKG
ncbi:phage tail protein [Hydrogenophaga sp.]|uniref:phage tail protein n=1 Tax=Hydrogenophaga sp. TaxID=1904254 RepID=UPI00356384D2